MPAQSIDLSDLLEDEDILLCVTVDCDTSAVVASVLEASKTIDEDVDDLPAVLRASDEGMRGFRGVPRLSPLLLLLLLTFSTRWLM